MSRTKEQCLVCDKNVNKGIKFTFKDREGIEKLAYMCPECRDYVRKYFRTNLILSALKSQPNYSEILEIIEDSEEDYFWEE